MNKNLLGRLFILIPILFILFATVSWADTSTLTDAITESINPMGVVGKGLPIVPDSIEEVLEHLGYPAKVRPAIEKDVRDLLNKIDFVQLKEEALKVKSDPLKLKRFVTKIGNLIEQEGYLGQDSPPLLRLLTNGFVDDDMSQVVLSSQIKFTQKVDSIKALVACSAVSQLGSIILDLLGIKVKVIFSPAHILNCIPLGNGQILFVDFSNQIFDIVELNKFYNNFLSKTWTLKDEYRIPPARLLEMKAQLANEYQSDSLQELLNFLYFYIYISDDFSTTPAIFINLANIYSAKGNYDQALIFYNKVIGMDPDIAETYHQRGITYANKGNIDQAMADLSKAIELFPDFTEVYYDRGTVYGNTGDIDNAIRDFTSAIAINPNDTEAYLQRGIMYSNKGDIDSAIADYSKAIEIDPYFSDAYKSRAEAYFSKQEYGKAREDVRKVEDFGDEVSQDLIDKLKNASISKNFAILLIAVPVLFVLIFFFFK